MLSEDQMSYMLPDPEKTNMVNSLLPCCHTKKMSNCGTPAKAQIQAKELIFIAF